jgi:hypothetical protein
VPTTSDDRRSHRALSAHVDRPAGDGQEGVDRMRCPIAKRLVSRAHAAV